MFKGVVNVGRQYFGAAIDQQQQRIVGLYSLINNLFIRVIEDFHFNKIYRDTSNAALRPWLALENVLFGGAFFFARCRTKYYRFFHYVYRSVFVSIFNDCNVRKTLA
jgi:hypothetical protein